MARASALCARCMAGLCPQFQKQSHPGDWIAIRREVHLRNIIVRNSRMIDRLLAVGAPLILGLGVGACVAADDRQASPKAASQERTGQSAAPISGATGRTGDMAAENIVFLRQPLVDRAPSAMQQIHGVLVLDSAGCLYLQDEERQWLIFWPTDVSLDSSGPSPIIVNSAGEKFGIGSRLTLGGSGSPPSRTTTWSGVTIPPSCRSANVFIVNRWGVIGP